MKQEMFENEVRRTAVFILACYEPAMQAAKLGAVCRNQDSGGSQELWLVCLEKQVSSPHRLDIYGRFLEGFSGPMEMLTTLIHLWVGNSDCSSPFPLL